MLGRQLQPRAHDPFGGDQSTAPPGWYRTSWFGIILPVAVLLGVWLIFVVGRGPTPIPTAPNPTVVYTVTGSGYFGVTGTADIYYAAAAPSAGEVKGAALPWTKTFVRDRTSDFSVSAYLTNGNSGTSVACTIKVNGKTTVSRTSNGQSTPNTVTCNP